MKVAMSLIRACRSLALSTWLLSFCFVHLLCLDFTVAEKEEWYTAFVNITYAEAAPDPGTGAAGGGGGPELRTEKTECGRYGEHSPKQDARGEVAMASSAHDRLACDPGTKFAAPAHGKNWIALIPKGNCTYRDKIRNAFLQNASAVVIFNVGSSANETVTMSHAGKRPWRGRGARGGGSVQGDPAPGSFLGSRLRGSRVPVPWTYQVVLRVTLGALQGREEQPFGGTRECVPLSLAPLGRGFTEVGSFFLGGSGR